MHYKHNYDNDYRTVLGLQKVWQSNEDHISDRAVIEQCVMNWNSSMQKAMVMLTKDISYPACLKMSDQLRNLNAFQVDEK